MNSVSRVVDSQKRGSSASSQASDEHSDSASVGLSLGFLMAVTSVIGPGLAIMTVDGSLLSRFFSGQSPSQLYGIGT